MDTTEDAEPTITSPMTQRRATMTARTVPVGSSWMVALIPDGAGAFFVALAPAGRDAGAGTNVGAWRETVLLCPGVMRASLCRGARAGKQQRGPTPASPP